jgi:hypothetical protein
MTEPAKQQSNPFSTGGGGHNFETRVQAAFTVLMLSGRVAPCLPPFPIKKLKLQGRYTGFNTDDFIVFSKHPQTEQEAKLLAQIKHDISITAGNATFAEVIHNAWNDFNGEDFDSRTDAFTLITGPLSTTDISSVRPILEWARHSENEEDFLVKVSTANFSSDMKRKKLEVFKTHLRAANNGEDVVDRQLWKFLQVFHLIGYDLDIEAGSTLSLLHSLIAQYSHETVSLLWARVVDAVQTANQNAGTITLETLPEDIRTAFSNVGSYGWSSDVNKLKEHGNYILGGIRTTVGEVHINQSESIAQLIDLTESSRFVLVSGERGSGKSSLIRTFSDYVSDSAPIFCLRTEDFDKPHLDNVFSVMGLKVSLGDLEAGFALMPKKYLIIESLEKLLELENTSAFSDLLHLLNRQQGWTVIATCRDYAYQLVTFHFLQPSGINFTALMLRGFSDKQVQSICEQLEPLQKLAANSHLKLLLKSPFFADLAYRVLETGMEFAVEDGEREFRAAVWRDVIAKEQVRTNGMPLKRKQTFINIAVKRARQMVYGVSLAEFDSEAVLKLEEDNLVRRDTKNSLVSLAHDVLEDWALEQYIEDAYHKHSVNSHDFLDEIGHEPAINRAFRLWLHQKLRFGENVNDFIFSVLNNQVIQRYWQDEAIAAVLQGDNPYEFLELLKNRLFLNDGELLKRFCFILRIACQTPDQTITPLVKKDSGEAFVDTLYLKPYGQGWKALICFLHKNKEFLSETLTPHVTALLNDWTTVLHLDEPLPTPAREAGLLALHLLDDLKEAYRDDGDRKKLLSVITKTASAIQEEFVNLLETDVFIARVGRRQHRPHYVDGFCEMVFSSIESTSLCKYNPDILIKLANFEWFIQEHDDEEEEPWHRSRIDVAECFGLHEHKHEFFPASGAKGPFRNLLYYHPRKGLDFILDLLNTAVDKYAHSNLDYPRDSSDLRIGYSEPLIEQLEFRLNDGSFVKQYYSGRLWPAYRGHSVVPYLLQCALMALENWLIAYTENLESDKLEWLFDYILRNSNSVMPTAVLASVAVGFPTKVGKAALPLLRTPELYFMDSGRMVHEMVGSEANWFGFSRDPFSELYIQERRTAALRPWRKEHLETLVVRLQFSEWRDEALAAIDVLRASESDNESLRFLFHRIDSRGWKPVADKENNRIIFEPIGLEPDLEEIQQKTQEEMRINNRFSALYVWARKIFEREPFENDYYATWREALAEAKELFEKLKTGAVSDLVAMYYGGIVVAAAIFMRDHSSELTEEDFLWCADLIITTLMANADTDNSLAIADVTDHDGAAAAATTLPILLDFASEDGEKLMVKRLIVTALTHVNENVRHRAADGVRKHLWQRDPEFAQNCIIGAIEYARFEKDNQLARRGIYFWEDDAKETEKIKLKAQKDEFRDQFVQGQLLNDLDQITLRTHSSWHILTPCLMIPDGSTKPEHIVLLSQMLALFFEAEQEKGRHDSDRDDNLEIDYKVPLNFTGRFAKYMFHLHGSGFKDYIEQLRVGCETAPSFMNYLVLCVAVEAEKEGQKEVYWQLWKELSQKVQEIAIEVAQRDSDYRRRDDRRELIRGMLKADVNWQKIDFENQDIAYGKELLLEFVTNAGKNPDVFEALAKLMHYFPSIFFESGIHVLSKHQREEGGIRLFSGVNTSFYLERSIQRFLQLDQTGPLQRNMHESCFILLNAIVETASSRAYYLREHLIRSRKIL